MANVMSQADRVGGGDRSRIRVDRATRHRITSQRDARWPRFFEAAQAGACPLRISILDDYFDTIRTLSCFRLLDGHDVHIWNDHVDDTDVLASRLRDTEGLVLIRERTKITATLL